MIIYLYVKTHNITGLKYLGKTINKDPYKYPGSGTYWTRHLKVHGYDCTTEILKECTSKEEVAELGIYYSELWNIVESDDWANLIAENGDGGGVKGKPKSEQAKANMRGKTRSEETKGKMSKPKSEEAIANMRGRIVSAETKSRISAANKGKTRSEETKSRISAANKGKTPSEEAKAKMSTAAKGRIVSEETKLRISAAQIGKPKSEETRAKMRKPKSPRKKPELN
jgi:hypothetical protein